MKIQFYTLTLIASLTLNNNARAEETVQKAALKSGSPILVSVNPAQPRQSVNLVFRGGLSQIQKNLHGAIGLYLDLLEEGPKSIPAEEYKKKLYLKNASISFSATPRALYVSVTAPQEHLSEALSLAKQTWISPKMDKSLFEHIKTSSIQQALADAENMRSVLNHFAFKDAFQFHPEVMDGKVSAKNQEKISFDDVKSISKVVFHLNQLEVYSSGPMTLEGTKELVQSQILGSEVAPFKKISFEKIQPNDFKHKELKVTILNKPAATDNQILFIFPNVFGETLRARVIGQVTSFLLGGSGSSDLFRILRTERGLTYGASSRVDNNRNFWAISTFGGIKQTPGLLSGIPEVVQKFRAKKTSKKDLAEAKKMLKVNFRDSLELPEDRLDYIMSLNLNDVDLALVDQYESILDSVTTKDIENFAKTKLTTDDGFLYLMGDEKVLVPLMEGKATVRKVQLHEVP